MPYGIDKNIGGDNPENVKWMEKCVAGVEKGGKDKSSAIAICKSQMKKKKTSEASVDSDVYNEVTLALQTAEDKLIREGKAFSREGAKAILESKLAKANYDIEVLEFNFEKLF